MVGSCRWTHVVSLTLVLSLDFLLDLFLAFFDGSLNGMGLLLELVFLQLEECLFLGLV